MSDNSENHKYKMSKCPPITIDANGNRVPLTDHQPQVSHCPAPHTTHTHKPLIADCHDTLPDYLKNKK